MGSEEDERGTDGPGRPPATEPKISLRKSGSIGVNQVALDMYFDDCDGAVLYYDSDDNRMAIRPVPDKSAAEAAYTVSRVETGGTIGAVAFLKEFDLEPDVTKQYTPEWDDEEDILLVNLDKPAAIYGSGDKD
jgi:hypothetical protein